MCAYDRTRLSVCHIAHVAALPRHQSPIGDRIRAARAMEAELASADALPVGHRGGPPLYGRMLKAIRSGHTWGNNVRLLKLPLLLLEDRLYAGAIAQFYWLTEALESALERLKDEPMVAKVLALGLTPLAPGYAADLRQIYGEKWREEAAAVRTRATDNYVAILNSTTEAVPIVAASFILYGALVVGGGKSTQLKVRKVLPSCEHVLFDVAPDMKEARSKFKSTFTAVGKEWPEEFERLASEAARFMDLNNTVVWSVNCWGRRATLWTLGAAGAVGAVLAAARWARS